ncbi:hypothetical protein P7H06_20030 [Paenibacillus larvae]|nr:hypothetical protein [Paenibacillus larvae]MDT2261320.1 hypothetical protein [Paenibacillus larvae]MDT2276172.1 hypothetical protein [Paenibacillus larvae]
MKEKIVFFSQNLHDGEEKPNDDKKKKITLSIIIKVSPVSPPPPGMVSVWFGKEDPEAGSP